MAMVGAFGVGYLVFTKTGYLLPWAVIAGPQMIAAVATAFIPLKSAFVSYRRVDGRNIAVFVTNELNRRGIEAFMDIKDHTAGRLEGLLLGQIARRNNFLLIMTPGMIERWRPGSGHERDWIGQEIERASSLKKTIVPVPVDDVGRFIENFTGPQGKSLPQELQEVLSNFKRSPYSSDQPEASVDGIARSMRIGFRNF